MSKVLYADGLPGRHGTAGHHRRPDAGGVEGPGERGPQVDLSSSGSPVPPDRLETGRRPGSGPQPPRRYLGLYDDETALPYDGRPSVV